MCIRDRPVGAEIQVQPGERVPLDGVVYGIHEDPHILDHRQAALRTGHSVQHLVLSLIHI